MSSSDEVRIRRAAASDGDAAVAVLLASRHDSVPAIPALVHADADVRSWFRDIVMASNEVWVAEVGASLVGVMVLSEGWIEQLYVEPGWTGRGLGSLLLDHAKSVSTGRLELWTFASNTAAQRFYERHGFVEIERTDGDNEEGQPDIRYQWSGI